MSISQVNPDYNRRTYKVEDEEITRMIRYTIALLKFKDEVGGYADLPKYLTVIAFEKMIRLTGEKFHYTLRDDKEAVINSIDGLFADNKITQKEKRQLQKWWKFRNDIVHPFKIQKDSEYSSQTVEILRFICERTKDLDYEREYNRIEHEDISILGKIQPPKTDYYPLLDSDFDDLQSLYHKRIGVQ